MEHLRSIGLRETYTCFARACLDQSGHDVWISSAMLVEDHLSLFTGEGVPEAEGVLGGS